MALLWFDVWLLEVLVRIEYFCIISPLVGVNSVMDDYLFVIFSSNIIITFFSKPKR